MPQEEEEETLSQVEETALLTRGDWCATMDTNMLYLWVILLFLFSSLQGLQQFPFCNLFLWFAIISQCCHPMAAEHTETILQIFEVLTNAEAIIIPAESNGSGK